MRLAVNKTYKMLIGGAFVRSESNHSLTLFGAGLECNYPKATRKDVRDAVVAARAAQPGWAAKTAMNRGQILYRIAEMMEARLDEFVELVQAEGLTKPAALKDVQSSIDRFVYYAGWADKFQQVLGTVNPVAVQYFNFSVPEPMGVVGIAAKGKGLLSLVSLLAPAVTGGNTVVILASDESPLSACEFAEIVATSDVPAGVVNILTGRHLDTLPHLAKHMDVNALSLAMQRTPELVDDATQNLKRLRFYDRDDWTAAQGLSWIGDLLETKTVWHPIGV